MHDTPFGFDLLVFIVLHELTPGEGPRRCMNLYVFELTCWVRIGEIWTKVQARMNHFKTIREQRTRPCNISQYGPFKQVEKGSSKPLLINSCVTAIHSRCNARRRRFKHLLTVSVAYLNVLTSMSFNLNKNT